MKIGIFTDLHSTIGGIIMDEAAFLIKHFGSSLLPNFKAEMTAAIKDNWHIKQTLQKMKANGPYDLIVGLGDYSQTGDAAEAQKAKELILEFFPDTPLCLAPGNHDTKSLVKLSDLWARNMSKEQLDSVARIFGPLYGSLPLNNDYLLVWLFGESFVFDWHKHWYVPDKTKQLLKELRKEQELLLREAFNDTQNRKIILCVHDQSILLSQKLMRDLIGPNRSKISVILTGHIHARWLNYLIVFRHPWLWPQLLWQMKKYKAKLIPSPWGIVLPKFLSMDFLHMAGGGWSELLIDDKLTLTTYFTKTKTFKGEILP